MQHVLQLVLQQGEGHSIHGHDSLGILDEVSQLGVAFIADGLVQGDRFTCVLLDLQNLVHGDVHLLG